MASAWKVFNTLSFRSVRQLFTPSKQEENTQQPTEMNQNNNTNENLPDRSSDEINSSKSCSENPCRVSPNHSEQLVHTNNPVNLG